MVQVPPQNKLISGLVLVFGGLYLVLLSSTGAPVYYAPPPPPNPRPARARNLPDAIIFGVRKCGTRALLEFIGQHPQVATAQNELHFFDRDDEYDKGLDWYLSNMPWSSPGQLTIEKTPGYFISPSSPERVWGMSADVRLILIVRDPVTRLLSDYTQILSSRRAQNFTFASFEELALDANGEVNLGYKAVQISIYHHYFSRWLQYFPRSQIHIVDGEELIKNPVSVLAKVESFLGLSHELSEAGFYFNATKGFYCMNSRDLHCLGASKGRKHPQIAPAVMRKLRQFYAPHNHIFYNLTGRDFHWPEE